MSLASGGCGPGWQSLILLIVKTAALWLLSILHFLTGGSQAGVEEIPMLKKKLKSALEKMRTRSCGGALMTSSVYFRGLCIEGWNKGLAY